MKRVQLSAVKREVNTKGSLNKVRSEGFVPAVVYGEGAVSVTVKVKERDLVLITEKYGKNVLVDLDIDGTVHPSIFKEIQKEHIGRKILHVDFETVNLSKPVYTKVPVVAVGEAKGVKLGGILDQTLRELQVEGLLTDLPEKVEVDVTNLEIKDVIYVHNLSLSDKVKLLTPPDTVVFSVVTPTVEEVAPAPAVEEVAAATAASPESTKEGKEPETGKAAKTPETGKAAKTPEAKPAKEEKK